jgi:hypothetical protein
MLRGVNTVENLVRNIRVRFQEKGTFGEMQG